MSDAAVAGRTEARPSVLIGVILSIVFWILLFCLIQVWPFKVSRDAETLEQAITNQTHATARIDAAQAIISSTDPAVGQAAKNEATQEKQSADKALIDATLVRKAAEARIAEGGTSAVVQSRSARLNAWVGKNSEVFILLLVIVASALGSVVHAAKSYAAFIGLKRYEPSWNTWYWMRVPTGIGIALFVYCVLRTGFAPGTLGANVLSELNPFAITAISALAGMFSREATDKLSEVFGATFRAESEPPQITSKNLEVPLNASGAALALKVHGANFQAETVALVSGVFREKALRSADELTVQLEEGDVKLAGDRKLRLTNPDGNWVEVTFKVVDPKPTQAASTTNPPKVTNQPEVSRAGDLKVAIKGQDFAQTIKVLGPDKKERGFSWTATELVVQLLAGDVKSDEFELSLVHAPNAKAVSTKIKVAA